MEHVQGEELCKGSRRSTFEIQEQAKQGHFIIASLSVEKSTEEPILVPEDCLPGGPKENEFVAKCPHCGVELVAFQSVFMHFAGIEKTRKQKPGKKSKIKSIQQWDPGSASFVEKPNPWKTAKTDRHQQSTSIAEKTAWKSTSIPKTVSPQAFSPQYSTTTAVSFTPPYQQHWQQYPATAAALLSQQHQQATFFGQDQTQPLQWQQSQTWLQPQLQQQQQQWSWTQQSSWQDQQWVQEQQPIGHMPLLTLQNPPPPWLASGQQALSQATAAQWSSDEQPQQQQWSITTTTQPATTTEQPTQQWSSTPNQIQQEAAPSPQPQTTTWSEGQGQQWVQQECKEENQQDQQSPQAQDPQSSPPETKNDSEAKCDENSECSQSLEQHTEESCSREEVSQNQNTPQHESMSMDQSQDSESQKSAIGGGKTECSENESSSKEPACDSQEHQDSPTVSAASDSSQPWPPEPCQSQTQQPTTLWHPSPPPHHTAPPPQEDQVSDWDLQLLELRQAAQQFEERYSQHTQSQPDWQPQQPQSAPSQPSAGPPGEPVWQQQFWQQHAGPRSQQGEQQPGWQQNQFWSKHAQMWQAQQQQSNHDTRSLLSTQNSAQQDDVDMSKKEDGPEEDQRPSSREHVKDDSPEPDIANYGGGDNKQNTHSLKHKNGQPSENTTSRDEPEHKDLVPSEGTDLLEQGKQHSSWQAAVNEDDEEKILVIFCKSSPECWARDRSFPAVLKKMIWPEELISNQQQVYARQLLPIYINVLEEVLVGHWSKVIEILQFEDYEINEGNVIEESKLIQLLARVERQFDKGVAQQVDPTNNVFLLLFDRRTDESGKIRDALNSMYEDRMAQVDEEDNVILASQDYIDLEDDVPDESKPVEGDKYEIKEEDAKRYEIKDTEDSEPFYHPSQVFLAEAILSRIRVILKHYHQKCLDDFNKFDFQIYTARSNMLEAQTRQRMQARDAGCFLKKDYEKPRKLLVEQTKMKVNKYSLSGDVSKNLDDLITRVRMNPQTLFLVVADEAHWGITSQSKDQAKGTANDLLVNTWNTKEHPNVIVLLVSATPYNLKTINSRIPQEYLAMMSQSGENIVVDRAKRGRIFRKTDNSDITNDVDNVKLLHQIKWSESLSWKLEQGLIVRLRVPQLSGKPALWLRMLDSVDAPCPWIGAETEELGEEFILIGRYRMIHLQTRDGNYELGVMMQNSKPRVGFFEKGTNCDNDFELLSIFGEDVFELKSSKSGLANCFLRYEVTTNEMVLGKKPPDTDNYGLMVHSPDYMLLIDSYRQLDESIETRQYLSLNFYFNTMRNEDPKECLIRGDNLFQTMLDKILKELPGIKPDDVLAAEYSYYILLIQNIRRCVLAANNFENLVENPTEAFQINGIHTTHSSLLSFSHCRQVNFKAFEQYLVEFHSPRYSGFKPIKLETFRRVVNYIQELSLENFVKTLSPVSSKRNPNGDSLNAFFANFFVTILNCASFPEKNRERISQIKVQFPMNWKALCEHYASILEDFQDHIQSVLEKSETFCIVNDLVMKEIPVNGLQGSMKIIRVSKSKGKQEKQADSGNMMYATLCLARKVASGSGQYFFEILRDYDRFRISDTDEVEGVIDNTALYRIKRILQPKFCHYEDANTLEECPCQQYSPHPPDLTCTDCNHVHKLISQYSDLNRLPCILILVEKGRMGDTFPRSFNVMDLRLNFMKRDTLPFLATSMQELGRLCRYSYKQNLRSLPYALVGKALAEELTKSLRNSAVFCGWTAKQDKYVRSNKLSKYDQNDELPRTRVKASKDSYDHGNTTVHVNRLLLDAEPQIGKTGVYLNLIAILRQIIEGQSVVDELEDYDEDSDQECEEVESTEESLSSWMFPYWKNMEQDPGLKSKTNDSKYSRIYGDYDYNKLTKPPDLMKPVDPNTSRLNNAVKTRYANEAQKWKYEAYSVKHYCPKCLFEVNATMTPIQVNGVPVRISIPNRIQFKPLIKALGLDLVCSSQSQNGRSNTQFEDDRHSQYRLKSWIFTPSYNRPESARLNLAHAMVDAESRRPTSYSHIIVVRPEHFRSYSRYWQATHAILELPSEMPGCETDVNEGGVGFARLFIQRFAQQCGQSHVFMIDDNIYVMHDVLTTGEPQQQRVCRNTDGNVELKEIPFYNVLQHMESQLIGTGHGLVADFQSHPGESGCELWKYTGPAHNYGILGVRKYRPGATKISKAFSKRHVFSMVLVNVAALRDKCIEYRPWQVFEDLSMNNTCDDNGLWVCKYNRYLIRKLSLKKWLPDVYTWRDTAALRTTTDKFDEKDCDILVKWIRMSVPPKRVELLLENEGPQHTEGEYSGIVRLAKQLKQSASGKHHLVGVLSSQVDTENLVTSLCDYFSGTPGIGGFDKHVIVLTAARCWNLKLLRKEDFEKNLLMKVFCPGYSFKVVTTHNVMKYPVHIILIAVLGQVYGAVDREKFGNLGKRKLDPVNPQPNKRRKPLASDLASSTKVEDTSQTIPTTPENKTILAPVQGQVSLDELWDDGITDAQLLERWDSFEKQGYAYLKSLSNKQYFQQGETLPAESLAKQSSSTEVDMETDTILPENIENESFETETSYDPDSFETGSFTRLKPLPLETEIHSLSEFSQYDFKLDVPKDVPTETADSDSDGASSEESLILIS